MDKLNLKSKFDIFAGFAILGIVLMIIIPLPPFALDILLSMHCHPHTQVTYIVSGRYRFTIGDETREVGPGDTLLKQDGVMHGCVCLEGGVMLDFFTPMREDFV